MRPAAGIAALVALVAFAGGCTGEIRSTTTARTAQEQLVLTTAAERAVARIDTAVFAGSSSSTRSERLGAPSRVVGVGESNR